MSTRGRHRHCTRLSAPVGVFLSCVLAWTTLSACSLLDTIWGKEVKSGYCASHPGDSDCGGTAPPDTGDDGKCHSNASCMAPTSVCDLAGSMTCVQCIAPTDTSACAGTTPVCGVDHMCQACKAHTDCPLSNACLPDGSCALDSGVAYVQAGALGTMCTQTAPCGTLDAGVKAGKPYVKIAAGTVADDKGTTIDGKAVTVLADPGAKLSRTVAGVILQVQNDGADVRIFDLEITTGTGTNNPAVSVPSGGTAKLSLTRVTIDGNQGAGLAIAGGLATVMQSTISGNQGGGISSTGGAVTVTQSIISANPGGGISAVGGSLILSQSDVALNFNGGISVSGAGVTFDITNNFIYRNGDPDNGTFGGLSLGIGVAGMNRLEFNTITDNRAVINSGGVVCNAPSFAAPNNIIARNTLAMSTTAPAAQTTQNGCTYPTSRVQSDVAGLMFVDPEAPAPFDYRLTAGSSAIDQALTSSPIAVDHDGKPRPIGAQKDIGAFEFRP
jgi:hypothetical protein